MTPLHPRTYELADPAVPGLQLLLAEGVPEPLQVAASIEGAEIVSARPTQVSWRPGSDVLVTYRVQLNGGLVGDHQLVAATGQIPEGSLVVESDDVSIGLWRVPNDPVLTGLPSALDGPRVTELLATLGAPEETVATRLRAYRPTRRAVVEVAGAKHSIYLKLVRPERVEKLHRLHLHLAPHLPVPETFGLSREMGLVALQTLPGVTLRATLENPTAALPPPQELLSLLHRLPEPDSSRIRQSARDRVPEFTLLLGTLLPELNDRLDRLVEEIGADEDGAAVPAHGDFYEAQVLVDEGSVTGLIDLDTYGLGRPGEDLASMIGHLALWRSLSHQPERVRQFSKAVLRLADERLDPADLRRGVAAVILSLALGPFRVLLPDWPAETERRVALAEKWIESATRVDENGLIPASRRS